MLVEFFPILCWYQYEIVELFTVTSRSTNCVHTNVIVVYSYENVITKNANHEILLKCKLYVHHGNDSLLRFNTLEKFTNFSSGNHANSAYPLKCFRNDCVFFSESLCTTLDFCLWKKLMDQHHNRLPWY